MKEGCECVTTPSEADYIVYESTGDPSSEINNVRVMFKDYGRRLVFILSGDRDYSDDIHTWFASSLTADNKTKFQIYTYNPRIYSQEPKFYEKKFKGVFQGTIWNTPERQCMRNLSKDWIVKSTTGYWDMNPEQRLDITMSSYDNMRRAMYTLCPRGNGPSSMRVVEALACGSIPVLINDNTNPFEEDFGGLAIRIKREDISNICQILNELETPSEEMFIKCNNFYKSEICKYNDIEWTVVTGFSRKIVNILREL